MKKIGLLVFVVMMMAIVTTAQAADVRAGGLPAVAGVSTDTAFTNAGPRAGGLPPFTADERIPNCTCKTDPSSCAKPYVAPAPAPKPAPAPAPVAAPVKEKVTVTLLVEFDNDKAIVKDKYYDDIKTVADFMKEYPDTVAAIDGHTDSNASNAYNQKLSERRANAVRQYLIDKFGIKASRLTATGYGEERPVATNDTAEGRQKNRRVEAVLEAVRIKK